MPSQSDLDGVYMGVAICHSTLSKAKRTKVGACMVLPSGVILGGVNGLPSKLGNICEDFLEDGSMVTKPEVIHAELNCIMKAAREGVCVIGSTVYVTLSPCVACSSMMISAGIKEVVYKDEYRSLEGITLLKKAGVNVRRYSVN